MSVSSSLCSVGGVTRQGMDFVERGIEIIEERGAIYVLPVHLYIIMYLLEVAKQLTCSLVLFMIALLYTCNMCIPRTARSTEVVSNHHWK